MDGYAVSVFFALAASINKPLFIITDGHLHLTSYLISTNSYSVVMASVRAVLLKAMSGDGRLLSAEPTDKDSRQLLMT